MPRGRLLSSVEKVQSQALRHAGLGIRGIAGQLERSVRLVLGCLRRTDSYKRNPSCGRPRKSCVEQHLINKWDLLGFAALFSQDNSLEGVEKKQYDC
ncbi:hypothetical protein ANCDUO_03417 [Ancylostoma duodenale]|uniref:Tc3 transposase DNA binding domain-containing protein n=1 Tax=Ancylostoma duodenale TaxID=51022 RepID=A0A0C2GXK3_9BILA|nr:hypothetical protein ANCDUO_03417 [Ancylostoma duodenale]